MIKVQETPGSVTVNFMFMVCFMAALSSFGSFVNDMFVPSMPEMTRTFGCSVSTMELGLTMGMVGLALGQFVLGPVSDKYGRKPVLVISLIVFVAAGLISIFSPTVEFFLVCRLFQGVGASGCYFLARTVPTDIYGGRALAKTMAIIGAINGVAPASAPVFGGVLSQSLGWRSVFVFLTVFAVVLMFFSRRLKETLPPERRIAGPVWHTFGRYITLMKNRAFVTHTMLKGTALGLLFAYISSATYIIQDHFGFNQLQFGLIMGGNAIFVVLGSLAALRFRLLKKAGVAGAAILFVTVSAEAVVLMWSSSRFWLYESLLVPAMFALGMIFTMSNTLAMNEGKADAGTASAFLGIVGYIFGAIVPPVVGLGDVLHPTAITFEVLAALVVVFALLSRRIAPDLDTAPSFPQSQSSQSSHP